MCNPLIDQVSPELLWKRPVILDLGVGRLPHRSLMDLFPAVICNNPKYANIRGMNDSYL